jgi:hypothetical protein
MALASTLGRASRYRSNKPDWDGDAAAPPGTVLTVILVVPFMGTAPAATLEL